MKIIISTFLTLLLVSTVATVFKMRVLHFFGGSEELAAKFFLTLYVITAGWLGASSVMLVKAPFLSLFAVQSEIINDDKYLASPSFLLKWFKTVHGLIVFLLKHNVLAFTFIVVTHIFPLLFWFDVLHIDLKKGNKTKQDDIQKDSVKTEKEKAYQDYRDSLESAAHRFEEHGDAELYKREVEELSEDYQKSIQKNNLIKEGK